MRIGILETDELRPEIKQKYGSYADMFQQLFLSVDAGLEFNVYQVIDGQYPASIDECDAYLITGSQLSAYDNNEWLLKLREYVVYLHQQKKKLIGICFGHQVIAHALGGETKRSDKGWGVGNKTSEIKVVKQWMDKNEKSFSLLFSHQDQVTSLPQGSELIASNDFCKISSFQLGDHILCFQGHPEFSEDYLSYLINKRRDLIGEDIVKQAQDSLKTKHDGKRVAKWLVNFIKSVPKTFQDALAN